MEVTQAFVAEFANVDPARRLNVIGMFSHIAVDEFPTIFPSLTLVVVFEANPIEVGLEKTVRIVLVDHETRNYVFDRETRVMVAQSDPGEPTIVQFIMRLNDVPFREAGDYQFSISVNGEHKRSLALNVHGGLPRMSL